MADLQPPYCGIQNAAELVLVVYCLTPISLEPLLHRRPNRSAQELMLVRRSPRLYLRPFL